MDPADLTPDDPEVMSCILIGNCSRWLQQALSFITNFWNLIAVSGSGKVSSQSALLRIETSDVKLSSGYGVKSQYTVTLLNALVLIYAYLFGHPRNTCAKVLTRASRVMSSCPSITSLVK